MRKKETLQPRFVGNLVYTAIIYSQPLILIDILNFVQSFYKLVIYVVYKITAEVQFYGKFECLVASQTHSCQGKEINLIVLSAEFVSFFSIATKVTL